MLETLKNLPEGLDGVRASGQVSRGDYESVLEPILDGARRDGRHLRFLYEFGPAFEGFTAGGAWEDVKVGLRSMELFDGCAIVSDVEWLRQSARVVGFLMPCPVRVFATNEREAALAWLQELPEGPGVSHRLVPESEIIVVEVDEPLRAQDFDALSRTADAWLEHHETLHGLVIRLRRFAGWENLGSLIRHVRFVRDHHRRIRRVAFVADGELLGALPQVAEHFVAAEVRSFASDEIERAMSWARGDE